MRMRLSSYTILGILAGLLGASWFAWHWLRPLPTTSYWPGWWYTNRSLSVQRLKLIAVAGILQSLGVIGISFYPVLTVFLSGILILFVGSLAQALVSITAPAKT